VLFIFYKIVQKIACQTLKNQVGILLRFHFYKKKSLYECQFKPQKPYLEPAKKLTHIKGFFRIELSLNQSNIRGLVGTHWHKLRLFNVLRSR